MCIASMKYIVTLAKARVQEPGGIAKLTPGCLRRASASMAASPYWPVTLSSTD
jgi:hypothetical protein